MPTPSTPLAAWREGVRDQSLDMVKGLLVVSMLVIHASNLFIESPDTQRLIYPTLLGFVSGSWLLISGYIIGLRYRLRYAEDPRGVPRRLFGRGWRLVAIFVISNVVLGHLSPASCVGWGEPGGCDLVQVFVLGDETQAFEVLLGIAYVLILAPLCLRIPINLFLGLTLGLLAGLSVLQGLGYDLPMMAWMLPCGIAGLGIGSVVGPQVVHRIMDVTWTRTLAASVAVVVWSGTETLFVYGVVGAASPAFYVAHVTSALWMLYGAGDWIATVPWLSRPLTILAHYSLFAYMGQMGILRLWRYLAAPWPAATLFPVSVLVAFLVLLFALQFLTLLRSRFRLVDRLYLSAFG